MIHPVDPGKENTADVFEALLATLPADERAEWEARWRDARAVEQRRRAYDRSWDDSLLTVRSGGQ